MYCFLVKNNLHYYILYIFLETTILKYRVRQIKASLTKWMGWVDALGLIHTHLSQVHSSYTTSEEWQWVLGVATNTLPLDS